MTFKDFIFILKLKGVPTEAVKACEQFSLKTVREETLFNKSPHDDLGYAELGSIVNKNQSIGEIVDSIWSTCIDFDSMGRDISKKRYAQLCANPHKGLLRLVAKSYYLHHHNVEAEYVEGEWDCIKVTDPKSLYNMNAFKDF